MNLNLKKYKVFVIKLKIQHNIQSEANFCLYVNTLQKAV